MFANCSLRGHGPVNPGDDEDRCTGQARAGQGEGWGGVGVTGAVPTTVCSLRGMLVLWGAIGDTTYLFMCGEKRNILNQARGASDANSSYMQPPTRHP